MDENKKFIDRANILDRCAYFCIEAFKYRIRSMFTISNETKLDYAERVRECTEEINGLEKQIGQLSSEDIRFLIRDSQGKIFNGSVTFDMTKRIDTMEDNLETEYTQTNPRISEELAKWAYKAENEELITNTISYVKEETADNAGHDWQHTRRVWEMAKKIQEKEGGNKLVIELAALLHDIADWKFNNGNDSIGPAKAGEWLAKNNVSKDIIKQVTDIIANMSFKGAKTKAPELTLEGKIVQDADRLDAIGAIGIARTFVYQGSMGREMYNPDIKPQMHGTAEQYKNSQSTTINHFHEKLLLLKDRMNTLTAKEIAVERHEFMRRFLERFYSEWNIE